LWNPRGLLFLHICLQEIDACNGFMEGIEDVSAFGCGIVDQPKIASLTNYGRKGVLRTHEEWASLLQKAIDKALESCPGKDVINDAALVTNPELQAKVLQNPLRLRVNEDLAKLRDLIEVVKELLCSCIQKRDIETP
jgi:hypothetical protein